MATSLTEVEELIAGIADRVGPAVVGLGRGWGHGSGVVIAPGVVLTSAHNLRGREASVVFEDGRRARAERVGEDLDLDLAVVTAETGDIAPVVRSAGDAGPAVGTAVLALANPGGRGLRVTLGHLATAPRPFRGPRGRRLPGGLEHTAPLPRGSSGGPLVDVSGALLGINSVRLDGSLILAVPVDAAVSRRIDALARGEAPRPRRLGVAVAPPHAARGLRGAVGLPERDGLLIRAVEPGSPAADAGLRSGDLIVAAAGTPVDDLDSLHTRLDDLEGDAATLTLKLVRGNDEREATVAFGDGTPG